MGAILDLAEKLWEGKEHTYTHHPFGPPYDTESVAKGTWFNKGFANTIIRKTEAGLIIVDPGGFFNSRVKFKSIRKTIPDRLHTAIFTHGHTDHVFGVPQYVNEAADHGWPRPQVIAHEAMPERFRRYIKTAGWNGVINGRQFQGGADQPTWPEQFTLPDIVYSKHLNINVGGVDVFLRHAKGETDDHTWVFFPDTRVLCTGDLFIYAVPNAGNPQKVQRYAGEWAMALRDMAALEPEVLAPGHGFPIVGKKRVCQALEETAAVLVSIEEQTLGLMNKGAALDEVLHAVKIPEKLGQRPYLQPVYDEPEFIVRNIYRLYGGWYDGMPSHLKPAPEKDQAMELARLAGGADKLIARAEILLDESNPRLACHLADWAFLAAPQDAIVKKAVGRIYMARAELEPSTMAMGIYLSTAREMGAVSKSKLLQNGNLFGAQAERGKKMTTPVLPTGQKT
jgi:alkyl sulfatase BDS1-like metallo-beta-lactamase superfamily hydrolase